MTEIKLVIFDCDGVLVDSEPVSNVILAADLSARGLPMTEDEVGGMFIGGTIQGVADRAAELGADIPDDWVVTLYEKMYAKLREGVPLIAGVEVLMDRLDAAGIKYCVGSNGSDEKMAITLGQHPDLLARLTGNLYSAHAYKTAKPDPELFLIAAKDFGIAPENCAVIDDSAPGCTAGVRANMRCFGLAEHDDGSKLAAVGATVVKSHDEIAGLLGLL